MQAHRSRACVHVRVCIARVRARGRGRRVRAKGERTWPFVPEMKQRYAEPDKV